LAQRSVWWLPSRAGAVCTPKYCPVDEEHPMQPNNPYSLSKSFGEQLCDAAVRRASGALQIISIRPSWCQDEVCTYS
jgi:nucleoside-diphosphate-sugar epimerase